MFIKSAYIHYFNAYSNNLIVKFGFRIDHSANFTTHTQLSLIFNGYDPAVT